MYVYIKELYINVRYYTFCLYISCDVKKIFKQTY